MIKRIWFWIVILIIGAAGIITVVGLKSRNNKKALFKEVAVERGSISLTILATGVIKPQNRVEVKPSISGRVEEIRIKEGITVKKGDIVAWMSSTDRAALLDAARAQDSEEVSHWEELYKPTPIFAPLTGVVISKEIEPGQTVTTQDVIVVISDRLIVQSQVDETDIGEITLGQKTEIILDAYPRDVIPGVVDHIAFDATTVNNVTIYEVDILPGAVPSFMKSGMTANVTFTVASKDQVLILPAEAVIDKGGTSAVMVQSETGKEPSRRIEVSTGIRNGKHVEIISGIEEGDTVLVPQLRIGKDDDTQSSSNPFMPARRRR